MAAQTHRLKKHKTLNNSNVGVAKDKISDLPDELIHHILSFIPIKCAMSTCILSKRWKYVAYSTPILDLRNWRGSLKGTRKEKKLETRCFMNFLDAVLFLHDKPNIQKFYLDVDEFFDGSRVNKWISTIMKHKIEEFGLSTEYLNTASMFPLSFFTCDSLTLLDLKMGLADSVVGDFIIPNTVTFPKLKILRLASLEFVDETSTGKFFSNCPVLEELSLYGCWIPHGSCIVSPTMKHLGITSCGFDSMVKISAPNLLTFSFIASEPMPGDVVLGSFPSLVEADVHSVNYYEYKYPEIFVKLLEKFSSAKLLKLCAGLFQVLSETDILLTGSVMFNNLIHLEISSQFRSTNFNSDSVRTFFRFLRLTPNLESIIFTQSIYNPDDEDDGCWSFDPNCLLPRNQIQVF